MNHELEQKSDLRENDLEEGQVSQNLRKKAKLKMGFVPIVSFTKHHLP